MKYNNYNIISNALKILILILVIIIIYELLNVTEKEPFLSKENIEKRKNPELQKRKSGFFNKFKRKTGIVSERIKYIFNKIKNLIL